MATVTPGLPLPLRNALAEVVIAALDDDHARAALAWLAAPDAPAAASVGPVLAAAHLLAGDGTLLAVHRPHVERIRSHAARGLQAAASHRERPARPDAHAVERAVARAIALWNAGLFFEVHEVLEAVWMTAEGALRHALQGVIQIAVALHHHAHGNVRGARTLMQEGRERLAAQPAAVPLLDATALLADTAPWTTGLQTGTLPDDARPPRIRPTAGA